MKSVQRTYAGPADVPATWNQLTQSVIASAMAVHSELGPGLLERFYELAFCRELELRNIPFSRQHPIRLVYKGTALGDQFVDLVVADLLIVELKAVEHVTDTHLAQLKCYMHSARLPLGLLLNFHVASLKDGIYRRVLTRETPIPSAFLSADFPSA